MSVRHRWSVQASLPPAACSCRTRTCLHNGLRHFYVFDCTSQEGDPLWPPRLNDGFNPRKYVALAASDPLTAIPDLTEIQTRSYEAFLQYETPWPKRKDQGIEGVLREIFPVESYDKTLRLEYIRYELGKPRYEPDECRQLRLTYGRPFKVWLRLTKEQPIEEEVYLGDIPIMLGGGEFIINGAERVVVSQLHRSPGVDFVSEMEGTGERRLQSCRIIPERGSWIELNVNRKESLSVRIDQSGKFSIMTLLRAMDPQVQRQRQPAARVLSTPKWSRSPTAAAPRRSRASWPSATSSIRPTARGPARSSSSAPEDHQERRRNDLHLRPEADRGDGRSEEPAAAERLGRRQHGQPRRGAAADLPAVAAGQSAAVGEGQGPVPREVLRHQPLPAGPRGPLPHQPQAGPEHPRRRR